MTNDKAARKYQLTINNPASHGLDHDKIKLLLSELTTVIYYCLSDEIGLNEQTPHTHIFIACKSPLKFSTLKNKFLMAHIEAVRGSYSDNKAYIEKSGKWENDAKSGTKLADSFEEWGEIPQDVGQGYRSDIVMLCSLIDEGYNNAEIIAANPEFASHIGKFDKIRAEKYKDKLNKNFRKLSVEYIFGATETGKTRYVMEKYDYRNVYRVTDYKHPFDGYDCTRHEVLVFDEFRSSIMIGEMLNYLDGYPLDLPARYANRAAAYTKVFIISNIDLKQQYPNIQLDEPATWNAFLRRIKTIKTFHKNGVVNTYDTQDYINNNVPIEIDVPIDDLPFPGEPEYVEPEQINFKGDL